MPGDFIPSAQPLYLGDAGNFRLKRICENQKEPESDIDRYKQAVKK